MPLMFRHTFMQLRLFPVQSVRYIFENIGWMMDFRPLLLNQRAIPRANLLEHQSPQ